MAKILSIIIPVYNEGSTIHLILDRIKSAQLMNDIQKEVVIINDCSKDDTEEVILNYKLGNPELNTLYVKHEVKVNNLFPMVCQKKRIRWALPPKNLEP